ncbi:MAG: flavin-dependent monooxygenase [Novosphingobium sp. 28-62-57]|uniref:flavin-dependent monooxygenase n=1 Tax=unclassified Novosphingobium TaxID=2644732 RepID=UPI000BCEC0FE|nr:MULTISPECIES: flavin-dependent monooxygenase [unclassified Novosphingobium]OYW51331.1 MAG: flavin-dependent monooxygenase [Novosphingobium sp. 12-62-10]OYZ10532.1 MAG: flavin-dependent monooxygenase [Novosphingobium sp. 28-62-57]OZA40338.1 MAG: flavin-dependent monooxygenase [Novosphingobium sp. 17-62-9]HQS68000.1 flavin-dependent monooxygenase [Novosphingobium sp.]
MAVSAGTLELISGRAAAGRKARRIADEVVEGLKSDGFFRHFTPADHGGLAGKPQDFFLDQIAIAERDMSTAWALGIVAVHNYQIALMDPKAQAEVYADGPDAMISSSYNPVGAKAKAVEGGFMLSGRWGWSSGCLHCNWVLLGGVIPGDGYRTFLVPASDYRIEDTWYTMGLQGTGSNDIVIDEPVFVPEHRTHRQIDGFNGVHHQTDPLYDLPWAQTFIRVVNTAAIGAVRHALALFKDRVGLSSTDMSKNATDPDVLDRIARASNLAEECLTVMVSNFNAMEAAGWKPTIEERVRYRYQASLVSDRCIEAMDLLMDVAGGRSVYLGSEFQDLWHDVRMSRAHVANNPTGFARNYANVLMGGENADYFL